MVAMVAMVIKVAMVIMVRTGQDRTKLTFKLDFPGNLWLAAFAILVVFALRRHPRSDLLEKCLLSQGTTDYESMKYLFLIVIFDNLGIFLKRLWNLFLSILWNCIECKKKNNCPSLNKMSPGFCCPLYSNQFDGSSKREHFEITKCDSLEATESSRQQREVMETTIAWYFLRKYLGTFHCTMCTL